MKYLPERELVVQLLEAGRVDDALLIAVRLAEEDLDDWNAAYLLGNVHQQGENHAIAYHLFRRAAQLNPRVREIWNNLGACCDPLQMFERAIEHYDRALLIDPSYANALGNKACALVNLARFEEALAVAEQGLNIEPDNLPCLANYGYSLLATQQWRRGWKHYDLMLGDGTYRRKEFCYGNEPRWDGSKGKHVVFYGEQGLGDEIMFASCFGDALADCKESVIECETKLANLFRRSFPQAHVYGNRRSDTVEWDDNHPIDVRCAFGSMPRFYRNATESFARGAGRYLTPNPELVRMWSAVMPRGKKPRIGIAWTGGTRQTGAEFREIPFDLIVDLTNSIDADWYSLEYTDPGDLSGTPIKHYSRATQTNDYDDTAAFVDNLDLVLAVPTSVVNLAGGLAVRTWIMRPTIYNWRFHPEQFPWHNAVQKVFKQKTKHAWASLLDEVRTELKQFVHEHEQNYQA